MDSRATLSWRQTYLGASAIPFWGVHLVALVGVSLLGFSLSGVLLAVALYYGRMFFVTAGYHRYFSHRSYRTSRWFQFVLAVSSQTSLQRGVLWWACHHRDHHRYSDTDKDLHSARIGGFWWSHLGWFLAPLYNDTDHSKVKDLARYPELRFLDRFPHVPGIGLGVILFALGGVHAVIWGLVSTVFLWHGTFTINSLSHLWGTRRYDTDDDSRNNVVLALVTMGEGWHNNHHHYQSSTAQGFFWWEIDMTDYLLRALARIGVVWGLRRPPQHIRDGHERRAMETTSPAEVRVSSATTAEAMLRGSRGVPAVHAPNGFGPPERDVKWHEATPENRA